MGNNRGRRRSIKSQGRGCLYRVTNCLQSPARKAAIFLIFSPSRLLLCCCPRFFFSLSIPRPSSFPTWKNRTLGWVLFLFLSCSRATGAKPRQRHQSANFANVSPDGISFCTPRLNRTKGFHGDNINWRKNMSNDVCISPKLQSCAK